MTLSFQKIVTTVFTLGLFIRIGGNYDLIYLSSIENSIFSFNEGIPTWGIISTLILIDSLYRVSQKNVN